MLKGRIVLLCVLFASPFSLFLPPLTSSASTGFALAELQNKISRALEKGGHGLLQSVINNTNYAADIKFIETSHDKLPQDTVGRIKRSDGKYLTVRKVNGQLVITYEQVDPKDPSTLWTFKRIKDELLNDWLGLKHATADGRFLGITQDTGRLQFFTTDFTRDTKNCHWQILESNLDKCTLQNRVSGGIIHLRKKIADIPLGKDKEEKIIANDQLVIVKTNANAATKINDKTIPGTFTQTAIRNASEAVGVTFSSSLYHWNGSRWDEIPTSFKTANTSISSGGDICAIDSTKKLWLRNNDNGQWSLLGDNVIVASIRSIKEIWTVTGDGNIKSLGDNAHDATLPNGKATWVSISDSGNLWAVGEDKRIWLYNNNAKNWTNIPGRNAVRISARSDKEAWVLTPEGLASHYKDSKWEDKYSSAADVSVSSGVTIKQTLAPREKRLTDVVTTLDSNNKPYVGAEEKDVISPVASIEITHLGMGGGISIGQTINNFNIPAFQNPRITGFAVDRIDDFDPAAILNLNPLRKRGGAWFGTPFKTPDEGGVSFLVRVRGDIYTSPAEVILGDVTSNSFFYKIVFGGWNNSKSAIIKREFIKGDPVDTVVYELTAEQYPSARLQTGVFAPLWVSYDKGLILAGTGEFGKEPFLAWRDPKPATGVIRVGFCSDKAPVQFSTIKITPKAIFNTVKRTYARTSQQISPGTNKEIAWAPLPFRMNDRSSIQVNIKGTSGAALILANKRNATAPHYAIVFGDDNNTAITIKKWHTGQKRYNERARIKTIHFPTINLDPQTVRNFWISYYFGQIVIGSGNIGSNPLYVFQDLAPVDKIDSFGFMNMGNDSFSIRNIQIGSPVILRAQQFQESYDKNNSADLINSLVIVLPFDYRMEQGENTVKLVDGITETTFYAAATPQQGAIYPLIFTIQKDGSPKLEWSRAPENPTQLDIQKAALKLKNEAEVNNLEAQKFIRQGEIQKAQKDAAAKSTRSKADDLRTAGTVLVDTAAPLFLDPTIGSAIGAGLTAAGVGLIAGSIGLDIAAAQQDYSGAELEAAQKRLASQKQFEADMKKQLASSAGESASLGLRSNDSYVFLDKPTRARLSSQSISTSAKKNQVDAMKNLEDAAQIRPTSVDDMVKLLLLYQNFLLLVNQSTVLSGDQAMKKIFLNGMQTLLSAYIDLITKKDTGTPLHLDMLTLLITAYNNPFLINDFIPDESRIKDTWYNTVSLLGEELITTSQDNSIALDKFYGEYVWLSQKLIKTADTSTETDTSAQQENTIPTESGIIAFEARGTDIILCFAVEPSRVRNTETEVYEVSIGGWDNTKSAIRSKSLDHYITYITKDKNPVAMGDPLKFKRFWVSYNKGLISVGTGEPGKNTFLKWQDPYPIPGITAIGLSSWNSRVEYRNIQVGTDALATDDVQITTTHDDEVKIMSYDDIHQNIASILDAFDQAQQKEQSGQVIDPKILDDLEHNLLASCSAGFNQRQSFSPGQNAETHDLIAKAIDYAAYDDTRNMLSDFESQMKKELLAQPAADKQSAAQQASNDKPPATTAKRTDQPTNDAQSEADDSNTAQPDEKKIDIQNTQPIIDQPQNDGGVAGAAA